MAESSSPIIVESRPSQLHSQLGLGHDNTESEILTDAQIQALLEEAEQRLSGGKSAQQIATSSSSSSRAQSKYGIPSLDPVQVSKPYVHNDGTVARLDRPKLVSEKDKKLANNIRSVESISSDGKSKKTAKPSAGPEWFNLPKTDVTPELKRDLQLLRMRNVLDPHRHYKKDSSKGKIPEFSQIGTVIQGPTEFFSSRIVKRDRKKTFLDEVATDRTSRGKFSTKYNDIQEKKRSGKKEHYKKVMKKRGKQARF
ncbi:hypothetical protein KEM54_002112 [Ascosphaera aggregata]|nr:hypothetical protein KEM54_002112 [Ascosphaera aggregata]